MRIGMESLIADNCYFSMQERVETKGYHSKGKDKGEMTDVPLGGNWMRTRSNRSKQDGPGKKEELSIRRNRGRKVKD